MSSVDALFATLLVIVVPGLLLAGLARWPLRSATTWAAVPVLSVGTIFLLAEVTTAIGSPFGVPAVAGLVVLLGAALVVRQQRDQVGRVGASAMVVSSAVPSAKPGAAETADGGERATAEHEATRPRSEERLSQALLVAGILLGMFIWVHGIHGLGLVPPTSDGSNHGFFVARIIHTQSVDLSRV